MKSTSLFRFLSLKWVLAYLIAAVVISVLLFVGLKGEVASQLGDTFGIAGALLSGVALVSLSVTVQQLNDARKDQDKLLANQQLQIEKSQGQIDALSAIAQALVDPVVVVRVELKRESLYYLVVENVGKSSAYNIKFDVEPKEGIYSGSNEQHNLADMPFIANGLPMLAPNQKISTIIFDGKNRTTRRELGIEVPTFVKVKCDYDIERAMPSGITYIHRSFTYKFSFDAQVGSIQFRGEIADELYQMHEYWKEYVEKNC
ncbi:MAG: hypothetical protein JNJ94_02760 [Chlorobi bacterium]|nr:hypothetical protein [Chlorobiota bacterium]